MSINSNISDPQDGIKANVLTQEGQNCLNVVTQEYKQFLNRSVYFVNPTYGANLAQDFSQIASTEYVHNGGDNTY